jgi:cytokinesis protein
LPDLPVKDKDDTGDDTPNGFLTPDLAADGENSGSVSDAQVSESEDVADRAASMLQGLRGDDADVERDSSLRVRRRRESADDERRLRRMRRRTAAENASADRNSTLPPVAEGNSINEGGGANDGGDEEGDEKSEKAMSERDAASTPTIIVSPTEPEFEGSPMKPKPMEIPD